MRFHGPQTNKAPTLKKIPQMPAERGSPLSACVNLLLIRVTSDI